jgi:Fur family transcriptional regulator, peroxide stress response regulator
LAATHQRQKIYEALMSCPGHYSPEEIHERVKQDLPSISLATVYNNLKTFVQVGMLHEVSPHHGPWRIEANRNPYHHLVCTRCRSITDLPSTRLLP